MSVRIVAGALLLTVMTQACAQAALPEAETTDGAAFCGVLLAEGAAYLETHAANRTEKMKVMRFASEEAMQAYMDRTQALTASASEMSATRAALVAENGLADDADVYDFDETTEEAADARIEIAKDCGVPRAE